MPLAQEMRSKAKQAHDGDGISQLYDIYIDIHGVNRPHLNGREMRDCLYLDILCISHLYLVIALLLLRFIIIALRGTGLPRACKVQQLWIIHIEPSFGQPFH